jgi:hypothetical protein
MSTKLTAADLRAKQSLRLPLLPLLHLTHATGGPLPHRRKITSTSTAQHGAVLHHCHALPEPWRTLLERTICRCHAALEASMPLVLPHRSGPQCMRSAVISAAAAVLMRRHKHTSTAAGDFATGQRAVQQHLAKNLVQVLFDRLHDETALVRHRALNVRCSSVWPFSLWGFVHRCAAPLPL